LKKVYGLEFTQVKPNFLSDYVEKHDIKCLVLFLKKTMVENYGINAVSKFYIYRFVNDKSVNFALHLTLSLYHRHYPGNSFYNKNGIIWLKRDILYSTAVFNNKELLLTIENNL
jgi:hypothetical protein